MQEQRFKQNKFTFQWHITDVCNYRCQHCYQSEYTNIGESFNTQISFLNKIKEFVVKIKKANTNLQPHINFTGGEPFLREDFLDLLQKTRELNLFSFGILSNGLLLSKEKLKILAKLKPSFIQISLEGNKEINDSIRGKGSYNDIINAVKTYSKLKIPVVISFTANSMNYKYYSDVVKFARKYKASKVWTDRYLPISKSDELLMSTEQVEELFGTILKEQKKNKKIFFSKTLVASNRALQFLVTGGQPYSCSAGQSLFAFLPNGDILPCRRLPIVLGNLKKDDLFNIYMNNLFIKEITNKNNLNKECSACYYNNSCYGGLKCLTYSIKGNVNEKDPNCWI